MERYYTIVGLSPALDGLDVVIEDASDFDQEGLYEILEVRDRNHLVGDRQLQLSVEPGGLFVAAKHLVQCKFPDKMEFDSKNPFGKFCREICSTIDDLDTIFVECANAVMVTVLDNHGKTVYSENFFGGSRGPVQDLFYEMLRRGISPDEMIFSLREIKDEEVGDGQEKVS